ASGATHSHGRALIAVIDPQRAAYDRAVRELERPRPDLIPKYERMRQALAECCRLDEAKKISAKASALHAYARQLHDHEVETCMAEIKLRALRRIGEIYLGLKRAPGPGRGHKRLARAGKSFELKAAKISPSRAHRAVVACQIPQKEFDRYIAECREQHR